MSWSSIWSALLGAASHIVWDAFTHSPAARFGWGVRMIWAVALALLVASLVSVLVRRHRRLGWSATPGAHQDRSDP